MVGGNEAVQDGQLPLDRAAHGGPIPLPERGTALDVGEEEGDGAAGQFGHGRSPMSRHDEWGARVRQSLMGTQRSHPKIDTKMIQFDLERSRTRDRAEQMTFRQARARSVLSVRELAARAGVAPATVYQIEHGRTRPHYRSIRVLSEALGVDPMQIEEFARVIEEGGALPATKEDRTRTTTRRKS